MSKLFKCCRKKAAADKAIASITFTVDELGLVHMACKLSDRDDSVQQKLYDECIKTQIEMLNFQSDLMKRIIGTEDEE